MSNFTIFYVSSIEHSAEFYQSLFGAPPVEMAPSFAMFVLNGDDQLGLWRRDLVEPVVTAMGGGSELCLTLDSDDAVEQRYMDWSGTKAHVLQQPVTMDFGRTFVVADPDGNRLRVFHPGEA